MRTAAELTLGREPDAVPRARRLVRDALADGPADLAGDAELVMSELVTNAALHGEPPITVRVLVNKGVRLEVIDRGKTAPILLQQGLEAMTGRGLAMVAAVASSWGVEALAGDGKMVWAELDPDAGPAAGPTEIDLDALIEAWADEDPATATYTVRLGLVPTKLLLEAKSHIDNVVRELVLMREGQASSGKRLTPGLLALIETVTVDFVEARTEIKRQAAAAAARGDAVTDLELHLRPASVAAGERYLDALDEVDRYARSAHLLTLAPPPVHRVFRRWYVQSLIEQLRALAAGRPAPEPPPFVVALADEMTSLDETVAAAARLAVLEEVSRKLVGATTVEEMVRIAVDQTMRFLGVESARVRLLTPEGVLRSVAFRDRDGGQGEPTADIPLESPVPAAEAVRTRRRMHVRSMEQLLEVAPELVSRHRAGLSGHAVPLVAGDEVLGVLTLTFDAGELTDQAELGFVDSLAEVVAQAVQRARGQELEQTHEEIRFVLDATTQLMASLGREDMLRTLARIAVPALGDICLIHVFDGPALRTAAAAVSEAVGAGMAEALAQADLDPEGRHPAAEAVRTGRAVLVDDGTHELLQAAGAHTGIGLPLAARGRTLGAMTLLVLRPRYRSRLEMVEDLGRRVSLALDNNHLYESARQAQARLALVARAGVTLTSSLDLVTVMGRLYDLIAGEISERCEVHVRRPPGQWWRFRSGPARPGLVRADSLPDRVSEAVDSGAPMVGRWPTGEVFSGPVTVNGDESPACSIIPLVAHGEPVGVIALCLPGPGEPVHLPAETVEVIAGRAALAVDNALLYEQERSAAEILQRSLLPHRLPAFPGLQAAARYLPAGARNEIGGDWYDLFRLGPDRVGMVMGDVMGRGIPAASVMGQLRNGLRMLAVQGIEPHRALELLNRMLGPDLGDELEPFATVGYGVLDLPSGRLMLASAGHLPPLLRRGETTRYLDQRPGLPLGAFPEAAYECTEHQLEPGDALVMYTDGLIERRDRTLAEGMEALLRSVSELSLNGPDTLCDRVLEDLRSRSEEDDTAVLVIRMNEA